MPLWSGVVVTWLSERSCECLKRKKKKNIYKEKPFDRWQQWARFWFSFQRCRASWKHGWETILKRQKTKTYTHRTHNHATAAHLLCAQKPTVCWWIDNILIHKILIKTANLRLTGLNIFSKKSLVSSINKTKVEHSYLSKYGLKKSIKS